MRRLSHNPSERAGYRAIRGFAVSVSLISMLFPVASHAQIYKCVGKDGRPTFQDSPCLGMPGTTVTVRPPNTGFVVAPNAPAAAIAPKEKEKDKAGAPAVLSPAQRDAARLKALETDRRRRAIDYDISEAEAALETLKSSMERDLAAVRERQQALSGSVPGSFLAQSAANDVQATSDRYTVQMRAAQDRIAQLKKSRDDLLAVPQSDRGTDGPSQSKP